MMGDMRLRLRAGMRALGRALRYFLIEIASWFGSLALLVAVVLVLPLMALGLGWFALPAVVNLLNRRSALAGGRASHLLGTDIPPRRPDVTGRLRFDELVQLINTAAVKRQLAWLVFHVTLVVCLGVVSLGLALGAVVFALTPAVWWAFPPGSLPLNLSVTNWPQSFLAMANGILYAAIAWFLVPWLGRRVSRATLSILRPRFLEMSERIEALSASRAAALDAHSAELRRIERELHDGAQNRLVGVVMMLGLARRALENDPAEALPFIKRAQDVATDALGELRAAVHDIYPPVLDDLGLGGAASSLTSRSAIPCTLAVDELRRAPAAVEAAAYFVIAEALSNAAKYSEASHVAVTLRTEVRSSQDVLVIQVADDGRGGATAESTGTGLAGIARRAQTFGGALVLSSPVGGPTTVKVGLPCGF
jgi:signal transduction histidine kinase